jgi:transposase
MRHAVGCPFAQEFEVVPETGYASMYCPICGMNLKQELKGKPQRLRDCPDCVKGWIEDKPCRKCGGLGFM